MSIQIVEIASKAGTAGLHDLRQSTATVQNGHLQHRCECVRLLHFDHSKVGVRALLHQRQRLIRSSIGWEEVNLVATKNSQVLDEKFVLQQNCTNTTC